MSIALGVLKDLPAGTVVVDHDGDHWTKLNNGEWGWRDKTWSSQALYTFNPESEGGLEVLPAEKPDYHRALAIFRSELMELGYTGTNYNNQLQGFKAGWEARS